MTATIVDWKSVLAPKVEGYFKFMTGCHRSASPTTATRRTRNCNASHWAQATVGSSRL
jgi:uncharacterized ParB-like nuclease family protein